MTPLTEPILFLATAHPELSRKFYEDVLRLAFVADEPYALVFETGGRTLRIQKMEAIQNVHYTVLGWSVPDIAEAVQDLAQRGVEFVRYERIEQDEAGVWTSPSGAKIAWFSDPDGHTLSLTQY